MEGGCATGLFLIKSLTLTHPPPAANTESTLMGGVAIHHYNHLEKTLLYHQVTKATGRISKQMPQGTYLLAFLKPPISCTKERGGEQALIAPLEKSHFPPAGVAEALLGDQMDLKTKVNTVIFCFCLWHRGSGTIDNVCKQ